MTTNLLCTIAVILSADGVHYEKHSVTTNDIGDTNADTKWFATNAAPKEMLLKK